MADQDTEVRPLLEAMGGLLVAQLAVREPLAERCTVHVVVEAVAHSRLVVLAALRL